MNFYFFGDSICFGQYVSPCYIFVNLLTEVLEKFSHDTWIVQNPSVNGRTTRQALEDMNFQIQSNPVDCLYVQFGMNDCNYWTNDFGSPRVYKSAFEANLIEIIERARNSNIGIIFLATNHPTLKTINFPHLNFSYQHMNAEYNDVIRQVAYNKSVILIDHEQWWYTNAIDNRNYFNTLLLPDGIHLSKQGHIAYAECASDIIITNLKKRTNFFNKILRHNLITNDLDQRASDSVL